MVLQSIFQTKQYRATYCHSSLSVSNSILFSSQKFIWNYFRIRHFQLWQCHRTRISEAFLMFRMAIHSRWDGDAIWVHSNVPVGRRGYNLIFGKEAVALSFINISSTGKDNSCWYTDRMLWSQDKPESDWFQRWCNSVLSGHGCEQGKGSSELKLDLDWCSGKAPFKVQSWVWLLKRNEVRTRKDPEICHLRW